MKKKKAVWVFVGASVLACVVAAAFPWAAEAAGRTNSWDFGLGWKKMARTKQAARKSTGGKAPATADYESCQEKHSLYQLGEKSSPLQARNHRASRNPSLPEIDQTSDPEAAFPEVGEGDRPGLQNRPAVSGCHPQWAAGDEWAECTWCVYLKILSCVLSMLRESPSCPKTPVGSPNAAGRELKWRQFLRCFVVNSVKYSALIRDFFYKKLLIICCICT